MIYDKSRFSMCAYGSVVRVPPLFLLSVVAFTVAALACFVRLAQRQRITDSDTRRRVWAPLLTRSG